jgi:hypothetical protein
MDKERSLLLPCLFYFIISWSLVAAGGKGNKKNGGGRVVHAAGGFVGMGGGAPRVDCLIFLRSIYYVSDCITWPRQHLNSHFFSFPKIRTKIKNGQERERWNDKIRFADGQGKGRRRSLKTAGSFFLYPLL